MDDSDLYIKVLNHQGRACCGGTGQWSLPKRDKPGDWMPTILRPEACVRGYHLTDLAELNGWLRGGHRRLFLAEAMSPVDRTSGKIAASSARLIRELNKPHEVAWGMAAAIVELAFPEPDADVRRFITNLDEHQLGQVVRNRMSALEDNLPWHQRCAIANALYNTGSVSRSGWDLGPLADREYMISQLSHLLGITDDEWERLAWL